MNKDLYYWAITGRIPGDDEDCPYVTPDPCTRGDAELFFRQFMVETALEDESEDDLRDQLGLDANASLLDHVYLISSFRSETMIHHG